MDLLFLFASRPNHVFSREVLTQALWPDTTVGEDALARCVFKLRRALDDQAKGSKLIETIPKRGYRLVLDSSLTCPSAEPRAATTRTFVRPALAFTAIAMSATLIGLGRSKTAETAPVTMVIARADDSYFQYSHRENEAAIALYERALAIDAGSASALSGLANALSQRAIRWPGGKDTPVTPGSALGAALASGQLRQPSATSDLRRAVSLARRAAGIDAGDPRTQRALGLALSASGRLNEAAAIYDRALASSPDDWGLLINRADLLDLSGHSERALPLLEEAYASMSRGYLQAAAQIRPWQSRLGLEIGRRHEAAARLVKARYWYRRTLADDPSSHAAGARLSSLAPGA